MVLNLQLTGRSRNIMEHLLEMNMTEFETFLNEHLKQLVQSEETCFLRGKTVSFGKSAKLLCEDITLILKPDRYGGFDYVITTIIDKKHVNTDDRRYNAFESEFNDEVKIHPARNTLRFYYRCGAELTVNET